MNLSHQLQFPLCLIDRIVYCKLVYYNNIFMDQLASSNPQQIILPSTHSQIISGNTSSNSQNPLSNKKHIAERLNEYIIHNIQDEIIESKITVSSTHRNALPHLTSNNISPPPKIYQIVKKRKELQQEITRLNYQQSRAKVHAHKSSDRKARSEFTKEEHDQVTKALEAKRQLDQEIALKDKRLEQEIEEKMMRQEAERKAKMQEICRQKQIIIAEHLRDLQAKKQQREREIKQLNKNYQSIKGRTFLHEKMQNSWRKQQKKHQDEDKDILTERKKGKEFSMRNIIEHEKKYRTFVTNTSKQKQEKIKQAKLQKEMLEKQILNQYQPSIFLQTIFQEEKQAKLAQQQRIVLIKTLAKTKTKYGDSIRQMNKQMIQKKSSLPPIQENNQDQIPNDQLPKNKSKVSDLPRTSKSMSRLQIAEIGNKYLREVHSSIGHIDSKQKDFKTISLRNSPQKADKYQDYLQDLKRKRAEKPVNPELREISELKQVLKRSGNAQDKLYHAKLIAGRLENKAKSNTNMLVSSINAKIAILNQFSN